MRNQETLTREVRAELARLTNTDKNDWFLVFRARYGVETVLQALQHYAGSGEVITQPFTCTTALNPIMSAGHVPVYIDTSYDDLSLDTSKLQASAASRAIIMQHSFGIESNMTAAKRFADKHDLLLIEDSAHQLGMIARDKQQPLTDISIHSFGVEKLLPTKFGGAVWVNPAMKDSVLRDLIREGLGNLPVISRSTRGKVRRYRFLNGLLNHTPRLFERSARSIVTAVGLFQPAIAPDELQGKNHDKPAQPDAFILQSMLWGIKQIDGTLKARRAAASIYRKSLPDHLTVPSHMTSDAAPVRFPILCKDRESATQLFQTLRRKGHYSGKWYRPILFPGVPDPKPYNYDAESFPAAEDISARIVNLPTNITTLEAKEIVDALHGQTN